MTRAIACLVLVVATFVAGTARAVGSEWEGSLVSVVPLDCRFETMPIRATVDGGRVRFVAEYQGREEDYEGSIGSDGRFKIYDDWFNMLSKAHSGRQQLVLSGTVGEDSIEGNFYTDGMVRAVCAGNFSLSRSGPPPTAAPEPVAAAPSPPAPAPARTENGAGTPTPLMRQMATLKSLLDQGFITEAEYGDRKTLLLDRFVGASAATSPTTPSPPVSTPSAPLPPIAAAPADEERVALVIGNGDYRSAPLRNPVNDARLIAGSLRSLGFEVIERLDLDQKGMKRAIRDFGDRLNRANNEAVALFYYAGHGVQVNGRNYLIPLSANIERESDVDIESVAADNVVTTMAFAQTRLNMVVLDACRDNPFKRGFRSMARGLARMEAPRGTLIAYATSPGDVAADGDGNNSPYSAALATAVVQHSEPVEQVFKRVRISVMDATNGMQVPWESSSLTGDFYFRQ